MTMLPPPTFDPDKLAAGAYAGALLLSSIGTLITVIVGAVRGGKKLTSIETATNGNASAMTAEIKRLELALIESMEARLASSVSARLAAEEATEKAEEVAAEHELQEKGNARGTTARRKGGTDDGSDD